MSSETQQTHSKQQYGCIPWQQPTPWCVSATFPINQVFVSYSQGIAVLAIARSFDVLSGSDHILSYEIVNVCCFYFRV